jgi:carboxyl-terminal processing protease
MIKYTFLFFFLTFFTTIYGQFDSQKIATTQKFDEVLSYINQMYVDQSNDEDLTDAAIVAMLEKLDPHSTYISKEEVNEANSSINGSFVGIGVRFQILKDTLLVVATIPGGPSEKLGILPGDKIIRIENENVAGIGLKNNQVREKLMGELGTRVKVEILRKTVKKPLNFIITRDHIAINSVDSYYMVTPEIGYLKLNSFSRSTSEEVQKGINFLKSKGMKHFIFDIQGNGGGLLEMAQRVADEFLSDDKLIVYSEGRAQPRSNLIAGRKGLWEDGTLILLTDEYSASASEIVSGAVQDWDRGMIVGRRTFGKGLVQRPIDLSDGSQIRLTIARYFTPSGRFIQKPYDNLKEYEDDLADRYKRGEFMNVDSIKFPDSLKFETKLTHRKVYGGGGIMPDIFVPLDTSGNSDFLSDLIQEGHVTTFSLEYVDKNRETLKATYPSFNMFKTNFLVDKALMDDFFTYVSKENKDWKMNAEQYKISEKLLKLRIKAVLAQDLWGYDEFYQIYNDTNEILQKAIETIENGDYQKAKLDRKK